MKIRGLSNKLRTVILTIFLCALFSTPVNSSPDAGSLETSTHIPSFPVDTLTISIDGNAEFNALANSENWPGDGTSSNPFVISGLTLTGPLDTDLIAIRNTDVHFQIRNCLLQNGWVGIRFESVGNGDLINNTISNNLENGFFGFNSTNCNLTGNIITNNNGYGVEFEYDCQNITISDNWIVSNGDGISITTNYITDPNIVLRNNSVVNNDGDGIRWGVTDGNITQNTITCNGGTGIVLGGHQVSVTSNSIANNSGDGIALLGSRHEIIGNTIANNGVDGISFTGAGNNRILDNDLTNNDFRIRAMEYDGLPELQEPSLEDYLQQEVENNWINGKLLIYWQNQTNKIVPAGVAQVILVNCSSIRVENQIFPDTNVGVDIAYCSNVSIRNNTITNKIGPGIRLIGVYNCKIVENFIANITGDTHPLTWPGYIVAEYGIRLVDSRNCTINRNEVINNTGDGIHLRHSINNTVSNNRVTNNTRDGICLATSANNSIKDNILIQNPLGFYQTSMACNGLWHPSVETLIQTEVINNSINDKPIVYWQSVQDKTVPDGAGQVILVNSPSITVKNQDLAGIQVGNSPGLNVFNNTISKGFGIDLTDSNSSILTNNTIVNSHSHGIALIDSQNCMLTGNVILNNSGVGIGLTWSENCSLRDNIIVNNSGAGIDLMGSGNSALTHNKVSNNAAGIDLVYDDSTITDNTVTNNKDFGIRLYDSGNCTVARNTVTDNDGIGIKVRGSEYNWIFDNILINNDFSFDGGFFQHQVSNNSINSRPLIYWQGIQGKTVPSGAAQIYLVDCEFIEVTDQNLTTLQGVNSFALNIHDNMVSNGWKGIYLSGVSQSSLSGNTVANHTGFGIVIEDSDECTLSRNTVTNNALPAISLYGSPNCIVSGNTVTNNRDWDWPWPMDGLSFWDRGFVIGVYDLEYTIIMGNNVTNNDQTGISVHTSPFTTLIGNTISNNDDEISLAESNDCIIINNTIINENESDEDFGLILSSNTANNRIQLNYFGGERLGYDDGIANVFCSNYWENWVHPDNNADGVVDIPYSIPGSARNLDPSPLVSPPWLQGHLLVPPTIWYPNGGENIPCCLQQEPVYISWSPAFGTLNHSIVYSFYYSPDSGISWVLIAANQSSTGFGLSRYPWFTHPLSPGTEYLIKIVARCSGGLVAEDTSDSTFRIVPATLSSSSQSSSISQSSFGFTLVSILVILPIIFGNRRNRRNHMKKETR